MREIPERFIAVDWSGDKTSSGQRRKIWIADWKDGQVTLTSGRTREEAAQYLLGAANESPQLVAGLDFAFSYPAWFVREQGCATVEEFWQLVADGAGERWLSESTAFCWGREGRRCPEDHRGPDWMGFRKTDREVTIGGIQPKSPFQIGGAGAVGTGSLRGIPILHELLRSGFSIWPFTKPGLPMAIEIYPRIFTGKGNKSSEDFRSTHLQRSEFASLPAGALKQARTSEDAFDALCSASGMLAYAHEFAKLQQSTDPDELLEGRIWRP